MGEGRRAGAARQDEFLERRKLTVELVERALEACDLARRHALATGNAEITAQIKKVILDVCQHFMHRLRQPLHEQYAQRRIELVDLAENGDAGAVFRYAHAVTEPGFACVARPRRDLRESVSHGIPRCLDYTYFRSRKKKPREARGAISRSLGGKRTGRRRVTPSTTIQGAAIATCALPETCTAWNDVDATP